MCLCTQNAVFEIPCRSQQTPANKFAAKKLEIIFCHADICTSEKRNERVAFLLLRFVGLGSNFFTVIKSDKHTCAIFCLQRNLTKINNNNNSLCIQKVMAKKVYGVQQRHQRFIDVWKSFCKQRLCFVHRFVKEVAYMKQPDLHGKCKFWRKKNCVSFLLVELFPDHPLLLNSALLFFVAVSFYILIEYSAYRKFCQPNVSFVRVFFFDAIKHRK